MNLANSSILMAMTSRIQSGKRQGITISSKLMADYLGKRAKRLIVIDEPLRRGWRHYPGMLRDWWRVASLNEPEGFDLMIGFDVVNAIAMSMARGSRGNLIYAVDDQARSHNSIVKWAYRKIDSFARNHADFILESSPSLVNGIVMPSLCPPLREEHFVPKDNHAIGYLGSLEESFGVDKAILAMPLILKKAPDAMMEIVGSGPERMKLEELARDLPIKFYGFLPDEEAVGVVRRWRVGLAPYTEAMEGIDSGKLKFYAWCGVPTVISKRTPQMVELVKRFGSGIEADSDPRMIAGAIEVLFFTGAYYTSLDGCRRLAGFFDSTVYFDKLFASIP